VVLFGFCPGGQKLITPRILTYFRLVPRLRALIFVPVEGGACQLCQAGFVLKRDNEGGQPGLKVSRFRGSTGDFNSNLE